MLGKIYLQNKSFGCAIRACREDSGMTQKRLAKLVDVDSSTIARWESEIDVPKLLNFNKLINVLPELKLCNNLPDPRNLTMTEHEEQARIIRALREQLEVNGIKPCV